MKGMKSTYAIASTGIYLFVGVVITSLVLAACAPEVATSIPSLTEAATDTPSTPESSVSSATALPALPLPVKDELTFSVVTQMGGTLNALAVDGNIVYLGIGPRLVTVDITDPAAPRLLWKSDILPGIVDAVAFQTGLAYVSAGHKLHIYETNEPANPVLLSAFNGVSGEIFPAGNLVYTTASGLSDYSCQPLIALDISEPTRPTMAGIHELTGTCTAAITIDGNVLYIASEGTLQLVNAANLDVIFSGFELNRAENYHIKVLGSVAYVIVQPFEIPGRLLVLDISDPRQPQEIATLKFDKFDIEHLIRDVAATDQALFLLGHSFPHTKCPTFLYAIDITNPASPSDPTKFDPQSCLNGFRLVDETLVAISDRGLQLFSVNHSANITLAGEMAPPDGFLSVEKVALNQGLAYLVTTVGDYRLPRVSVLDVTNPNPRLLNGGGLDLGSDLEPEAFYGPYVLVRDILLFNASLIDLSDPADPHLATGNLGVGNTEGVFYWRPTPALVDNVLFTGLLTADGSMMGGLGIVDISDPANPVLVDTVPMEGFTVTGMSVADRHLIVFSQKQEGSRLQIYDVRNPFKPIEVGGLHMPIEEPVMTTIGDTIYLATGYGDHPTLYAVDISNPAQPIEVGRFELPNNARKMVVVGESIYMDGIWALNVSDRSHPYLAGHLPIPIGDFDVAGDLLYLAAGDGGLYILQVEK